MIAAFALVAAIALPPAPADYVDDTAHALSASAASAITQELRTYDQTTGNRVVVYIGETTGDTPLEDWTIHAAENWKIFSKNKPDGAILFAFMKDHKVRIEVGYGLEGALPDATAYRIIEETIVPKMRSGDVDGAIGSGVDRMLLTITPSFKDKIGHEVQQAPAPSQQDDTGTAIAVLIVFLIFGALFVFFIGSLFNKRWRSAWYWGAGSGGSGGWFSGGGGGGGFSSGGFSGGGGFGGGFGGGGASGGW